MNMNGIEKVTGKITADAEAAAKKTLDDAKAERDRVISEAGKRAEKILSDGKEAADKEAALISDRAKSQSESAQRNILLKTKSAVIDDVFERARKKVISLPPDEYLSLMTKWLCTAIQSALRNERHRIENGTADEYGEVSEYILTMNLPDKAEYGNALLAAGQTYLAANLVGDVASAGADIVSGIKKLVTGAAKGNVNNAANDETVGIKAVKEDFGKLSLIKTKKLSLSEKTADIDGGFILGIGDIEMNCSVGVLAKQACDSLAGKVAEILFGNE